ncbi:MAG: glycosyltransferase, partial [Candidatus Nanopelagicales bacterium]
MVHNGTEPLPDVGIEQDAQPRILVLGRLVPHKRVEHAIAAAAALRQRHPGLTLAVVGDGWWSQELRQAARDRGVEDIVEFTGHVDDDEKARQVARAWVLALPSLKEGWG